MTKPQYLSSLDTTIGLQLDSLGQEDQTKRREDIRKVIRTDIIGMTEPKKEDEGSASVAGIFNKLVKSDFSYIENFKREISSYVPNFTQSRVMLKEVMKKMENAYYVAREIGPILNECMIWYLHCIILWFEILRNMQKYKLTTEEQDEFIFRMNTILNKTDHSIDSWSLASIIALKPSIPLETEAYNDVMPMLPSFTDSHAWDKDKRMWKNGYEMFLPSPESLIYLTKPLLDPARTKYYAPTSDDCDYWTPTHGWSKLPHLKGMFKLNGVREQPNLDEDTNHHGGNIRHVRMPVHYIPFHRNSLIDKQQSHSFWKTFANKNADLTFPDYPATVETTSQFFNIHEDTTWLETLLSNLVKAITYSNLKTSLATMETAQEIGINKMMIIPEIDANYDPKIQGVDGDVNTIKLMTAQLQERQELVKEESFYTQKQKFIRTELVDGKMMTEEESLGIVVNRQGQIFIGVAPPADTSGVAVSKTPAKGKRSKPDKAVPGPSTGEPPKQSEPADIQTVINRLSKLFDVRNATAKPSALKKEEDDLKAYIQKDLEDRVGKVLSHIEEEVLKGEEPKFLKQVQWAIYSREGIPTADETMFLLTSGLTMGSATEAFIKHCIPDYVIPDLRTGAFWKQFKNYGSDYLRMNDTMRTFIQYAHGDRSNQTKYGWNLPAGNQEENDPKKFKSK